MADQPQSMMQALLDGPLGAGRLQWIGVRSKRRGNVEHLERAQLVTAQGIDGDHYQSSRNGARQVTMIAEEDIQAVASFLGRARIAPEILRRNIVTKGINVIVLKNRRFRIGAAVLEGSGECAPCSLMEDVLGPGGFNAMRGHGGITARIIEGGEITVGDTVSRVD